MIKRNCLYVFCGILLWAMSVLSVWAQGCDIGPLKHRTFTIGIVTDGATPADKELVHMYEKELNALSDAQTSFRFPDGFVLSGGGQRGGAKKALSRLFSPGGPDIILTLGVISAAQCLDNQKVSRPVVAPFVAWFTLKDKIKKAGSRNIGNMVYVDSVYHLDSDIDTFRKIVKFKDAVLILDRREIDAFPVLPGLVQKFASKHGISLTIIPAENSADKVLNNLPATADAAFVGALWHFDKEQMRRLAQGLINKRVAGFALWSEDQVEEGLLAGLESKEKQDILARRTAVAVTDILSGKSPSNINVDYIRNRRLTINMATARAIDVYPSLLIITKAHIINGERKDIGRRLNIKKAVNEAVEANLRLQAAKTSVRAGEHAVKEAMADLLPRIDIATGARAIDQDRAKAGGGMSPERAWTGTAGGSVLLYSDKKWANYTAEEHLQKARQMNMDSVRLDVTYDASVAYLRVLRAKTIERIYKENLKLTEANLERARIKVATGAAGPDEVYRWEAKYANDRREVLYRESDTMDAMEALNRVLHRPLQELFEPEEASLKDPLFIIGDKFFYQLMENPKYMRKFRGFAAKRALELRPELKGYDAAIKAKERLETAARRQIWLPDFTVEWKVDQYFAEDGEGRRDSHMSNLDDTDWNVGVFARIPLFEGGKRVAQASRLQEEVSRLRINRGAKAEAIIQNVLAALNRTRASYPSITLSRQASEAARRNLDLVTDFYMEGIKTIIDLLDAQNQALSADLDAANAVYNFLIDFMGVERAIGEFVIFMPDQKRQEWLNRVYAAIGMVDGKSPGEK